MTVARRDEFVKTVQGPAVPGAQIFVCTQPANVKSVPPSPLANIFSDPNGVVPIIQPVLTDGFGHAFFYVATGTYTIVVAVADQIQQVYPDQFIATAGGIGSITFESNGTPNIDQSVLNLKDGASITVTADGVGGVVIDLSTPIPPAILLQTGGVTNTSQSKLNLESTDASVTISSDASGNVNFQVQAGIIPVNATGPFIIGPGFFNAQLPAAASSGINGGVADCIKICRFMLPFGMTIARCSFLGHTNTSGAISFAIYSADGSTKIVDSGLFSAIGFVNPTVFSNTFAPVVVPAGAYWLACTDAAASSQWVIECLDSAGNCSQLTNGGQTSGGETIGSRRLRMYSITKATGGVLPSSISVTTPAVLPNIDDFLDPACIWESQ